MELNTTIIDLLKSLKSKDVSFPDEKTVLIRPSLVEINEQEIRLLNKLNVESKISPKKSINTISLKHFQSIIDSLGNKLTRLNHIGVSYYCADIATEIGHYRALVEHTDFKLYKEMAEDPNQQWIFLRNPKYLEAPMFEIVLTQGNQLFKEWIPHFQIDIDTNLAIEELHERTDIYFGKGFIQWELNVPQVGVVLGMGTLGEVDGVKIALGLGTDKRNIRIHRLEELKQV